MKYHINIPMEQKAEHSPLVSRFLKLTEDLACCVSFLADNIVAKATIRNIEEKVTTIEQMHNERKVFLNIDEACVYLRVSRFKMNQIIKSGQLTHFRVSTKKLFFKRSDLDQWILQRNRVVGNIETNLKNQRYE